MTKSSLQTKINIFPIEMDFEIQKIQVQILALPFPNFVILGKLLCFPKSNYLVIN